MWLLLNALYVTMWSLIKFHVISFYTLFRGRVLPNKHPAMVLSTSDQITQRAQENESTTRVRGVASTA